MGRNRQRTDPDRYIFKISGNYHYKRRVPIDVAHLDSRAPHVRKSLKTRDLALARRKRNKLEEADDALWASMMMETDVDPARRRYEAAVKRVEAMDFVFHPARDLELPDAFGDLVDRLRLLVANEPRLQAVAMPLMGAIEVPRTTLTKAFEIYCDEIVADELVGKSRVQRDQWRKVKQRAVNNFVALVGDKAMTDITVDDGQKIYRHWLARIAPKNGAATASASSGNRDIGNLRVLYQAYFKYQGDTKRPNPFEGLGYSGKKKKRPPFPTSWLRDTIMGAGRLATLNDEARGIVLAMIETGARPSELANLSETAIRLAHPVPHIAIEPRDDPDDPREIKTESSQRMVPLVGIAHTVFLKHSKGFPRYRDRENDLSNTLNKYFRTNSLFPTPKHKIYSIRHSFEDRMKEGNLDEELRRILMGHTIDRPSYGSGGSLEWRRDQLLRIVLQYDPTIV